MSGGDAFGFLTACQWRGYLEERDLDVIGGRFVAGIHGNELEGYSHWARNESWRLGYDADNRREGAQNNVKFLLSWSMYVAWREGRKGEEGGKGNRIVAVKRGRQRCRLWELVTRYRAPALPLAAMPHVHWKDRVRRGWLGQGMEGGEGAEKKTGR